MTKIECIKNCIFCDFFKQKCSSSDILLLGHTQKLHEKISRSRDFKATINRIRKTDKADIVICKQNYKYLKNIVELLNKLNIKKIEFIFPEPTEGKETSFYKTIPTIGEAVYSIDDAIKLAKKNRIEIIPDKRSFDYKKPKDLTLDYSDVKPDFKINRYKNKPEVSVIIPTCNRKDYLKCVLKALFTQNYDRKKYNIIIADDYSQDGTKGMVKSLDFPCNLLYFCWHRKKQFEPGEPGNRAGPLRNLGAKYADGKILIFIDSDVLVNKNFIKEHVESCKKNCVVIAPSIREREKKDERDPRFAYCNDNIDKYPSKWTLLHSGNFSVHKKDFFSVGGFDQDFIFYGMEDEELGYKLYKKGLKFVLNRNAYGIHLYHPAEPVNITARKLAHTYHVRIFYKKHLDIDIRDRLFTEGPYFCKDHHQLISVGNMCNNNCIFCSSLLKKSDNRTFEEIKEEFDLAKENNMEIVLTGGEPAIRKDFIDIIKYANKIGLNLELMTNGRLFSYRPFCKKVIKYMKDFIIYLYAPTAALHDKLTQTPGSFEQTINGIKNLLSLGIKPSVYIVICKDNQHVFEPLLSFICDLGIHSVHLKAIPSELFNIPNFVFSVDNALLSYPELNIQLRSKFFECFSYRYNTEDFFKTKVRKTEKCASCKYLPYCTIKQKDLFLNQKKTVFFRDDDVAKLTDNLKRLMDMFISEKIPINLQLIPNKLSKETAEYLKKIKKEHPELIELNQHGWNHTDYGRRSGSKKSYEFGNARTYKEQYNDILKGKEKLRLLFGDDFSPVFSPSYHGFNEDTLKALDKLGFDVFPKSADIPTIGISRYKFTEPPPCIDVMVWGGYKGTFKPETEILEEFESCKDKCSTMGILLHHEMLKEKHFDYIKRFIRKLKQQEDITFKTFQQIKHEQDTKVLLINPSYQPSWSKCEPTGLMQVASYLEDNGVGVEIFDFNIKDLDKNSFKTYLELVYPKYVAITAQTLQALQAYKVGNFVKKHFPKVKLIYGGIHPTFLPKEAFELGKADYVIMGEGEKTLLGLINSIKDNKDIKNIRGLAYKSDKGIVINGPGDFIDLNELPFPAYHLVPLEMYNTNIHVRPFDQKNSVHLMTSRGCPNNCAYCSSPSLYKRKVRFKSVEKIIDEIKYITTKLNIGCIHFHDDNFLLDYKRVNDLCNRIIKNKLKFRWICLASIDTVIKHPKVLESMKRAGCVGVELGVECGDERVLKKVGKEQSTEQVKEAVELVKKNSLVPMYLMMSYNIGETIETPYLSAKLLYELDFGHLKGEEIPEFDPSITYLMGHLARPSPGAKFYWEANKQGIVLARNWGDHFEERINFIPNTFLNDVPVKNRLLNKKDALDYIFKYEGTIKNYVCRQFYSTYSLIQQNFKQFGDFMRFLHFIYTLCDSKKTVKQIAGFMKQKYSVDVELVASAISMLSILRLIKSDRC